MLVEHRYPNFPKNENDAIKKWKETIDALKAKLYHLEIRFKIVREYLLWQTDETSTLMLLDAYRNLPSWQHTEINCRADIIYAFEKYDLENDMCAKFFTARQLVIQIDIQDDIVEIWEKLSFKDLARVHFCLGLNKLAGTREEMLNDLIVNFLKIPVPKTCDLQKQIDTLKVEVYKIQYQLCPGHEMYKDLTTEFLETKRWELFKSWDQFIKK